MPPPRRSTPRKSRAENAESATSSPAKSAAASPLSTPADTPRRAARGRRATAKAAAAADTPKTQSSTPSRSRGSRTTKAAAAAAAAAEETAPEVPASPAPKAAPLSERVHALPTRTNPRLAEVKSRQVKLQVIRREDKEIIIGRIKLPTVNGAEHGFLLKRFDTNAIAGSSMFRLAFPYADGEEESAEMAYLESRFDTNVANGGTLAPATPRRGRKPDPNNAKSNGSGVLPPGSTGVRLQGVWIPCEQAAPIAEDYGLLELAQPLLEATAVLLPNDDVPLLNPDADTLALAAESERVPLSTPQRQAKRARTAESMAADAASAALASPSSSTPMQAAQQLLGTSAPETPTSPSKRRAAPRRTRAAMAAAAAASEPGLQTPMTPAQIDAQIRAAKELAADIAADSDKASSTTTRAKRRAEEEADGEVVVAPQGQTATRALRRRVPHSAPLVRAAGALTAAGALGVGAAAWYAGTLNLATAVPAALQQLQRSDYSSALQHLQHIDYSSALHRLQQNIQSWGTSWFGS